MTITYCSFKCKDNDIIFNTVLKREPNGDIAFFISTATDDTVH